MKDRSTNPHPGPFRIPRVDAEFAGILVAVGFVVMGLVAFPFAKWFLVAALLLGICVVLMFRLAHTRARGLAWVLAALIAVLLVGLVLVPHRQNDSAAIRQLRRIHAKEMSYAARNNTRGFACALSELQEPAEYSGYRFEIRCPIGDAGPVKYFRATAEPIELGLADSYCIDANGNLLTARRGTATTCIFSGAKLNWFLPE